MGGCTCEKHPEQLREREEEALQQAHTLMDPFEAHTGAR